jgi:predicted nucleic acid-binding protein
MVGYVVADTSVISRLTSQSADCAAYQAMIGDLLLAVSFQTPAELLSFPFGPARRQRLDDLLAATVELPHSEATNVWYSRVVQTRATLKKAQLPGGDAQDGDAWIIGSSLEHSLDLLSHDAQQVHLGRAAGLRVFTNILSLRDNNPPPLALRLRRSASAELQDEATP